MNDRITLAATGAQVPGEGEIYLDHVGWFVRDMERASAVFTRLGFPLTPYSVHGDRDPATGESRLVGSANRLAMLERGYLEILTPVDGTDTPVSRHMRACLEAYQGIHLAAFTVADAEAEAEALPRRGFSVMPTVNLRRAVETAQGDRDEVAFTVIRAELGSVPEGRLQTLTHHTPELMWQPRHVARDNGFRALSGLVWASEDPAESGERLARYTGRPVRETAEGSEIQLDRGMLRVVTPRAARDRYGRGLPEAFPAVVAVLFEGSVETAARHLDVTGISFSREEDGVLVVPGTEALGSVLVLHEKDA